MGKAVLVIDMPNSCSECPLFRDTYNDMPCSVLNYRYSIDYPYPKDFRQVWCPLKSLSENVKIDEILGG